ncbi:MAG: choice-of-anchor B family protein [Chitinophagales bacterium]|nr:choice-of-anchor B family protein [Chitinophagales bacterium]
MKTIIQITLLLLITIPSSYGQNFNLELRGEISYPYSCASIWGYVDDDGTEYALVGTYAGVSIVDISDPDNPVVKFDVPHTQNLWREIKTYGHYAYATNEVGDGLLVIDLSDLPNSVTPSNFIYTDAFGTMQSEGHTLWIDENGKLFIFGGDYGAGGATIFNLAANPLNPPYLGKYEQHYIHDGFVRGDTLWASEIYDGKLEIVDVSNPLLPVPLGSVNTPNFFTHNAWPTHDNHYAFTTDEVDNSYLTAYDVSNLSNITEVDRIQSNPGSGSIVHNVHLLNDQFAWTAYYKDGVALFDVSHPDNMIQVAAYDTDPQESGGGYGGSWGVYPYLPSGNIIVSDLYTSTTNGKLTIITPTYVSACWLEGNVTNAVTSASVNNALVEILTTTQNDYSDLGGNYKTGSGIAGTYTVRVSKAGYVTKEIQDVILTSGSTVQLDVQLSPLVETSVTGTVTDSITAEPLANAHVYLHALNVGLTYEVNTNASGNFSISPIFEDSYEIYAGKWGYRETGIQNITINQSSSPVELKISKGYYDDFIVNNNWTITGNANTGSWERGEPIGTSSSGVYFNPEEDIAGDYGNLCFVTGNGGGGIGTDDVDNGSTTLTSPVMDLSEFIDPILGFYSWFANGGGSGTPNDTLFVSVTNGTVTVKIASIKNPMSQWNYHEYHLDDYLASTASMKVIFTTSDLSSSSHVVEAAVDGFRVYKALSTGTAAVQQKNNCCELYPNPFSMESSITYNLGAITFKEASVSVHSIIGQLVESHAIHSPAGSITWGADLPAGLYIVKVAVDNEQQSIFKVIKSR